MKKGDIVIYEQANTKYVAKIIKIMDIDMVDAHTGKADSSFVKIKIFMPEAGFITQPIVVDKKTIIKFK